MDLSNYDFVKKLNEGSFGLIHLVRRKEDNEEVVIKKQKIDSNDFAINEVSIMSKLNHPNIIAFYESWEDGDDSYICMEYISGPSLFDLINEAYNNEEPPMTDDETLSFLAQLVLGVDHMHQQNIIHRDLKPENVLFAGPEKIVKIIDFGLSKDDSADLKVCTVNPNDYTAPEIWFEEEEHTFKSDIWSIGALLYEVITCIQPKELKYNLEVLEDLPTNFKTICGNILKILPDERPNSHEILKYIELRSTLITYYQTLESSEKEIVRQQIEDIIDSENEPDE